MNKQQFLEEFDKIENDFLDKYCAVIIDAYKKYLPKDTIRLALDGWRKQKSEINPHMHLQTVDSRDEAIKRFSDESRFQRDNVMLEREYEGWLPKEFDFEYFFGSKENDKMQDKKALLWGDFIKQVNKLLEKSWQKC